MVQRLVWLVYYSSARQIFDEKALSSLLKVSRRNNKRLDVTGMLLFHDGNFIQALEGPEWGVNDTFERIKADRTHGDIRSIGPIEIEQRFFAEWSMGVMKEDLLNGDERSAVTDFLRSKGTVAPASLAWRLLHSFRASIRRQGGLG